MKIGKGLLFKIIAICVSACLFADTIAYAAPCLRPNSIFDEINRREDEDRFDEALSTVGAAITSNVEQAKSILESLRPDFGGKDELTASEFEKHVKKKVEEIGFKYRNIEIQPWNSIYYIVKELMETFVKLKFYDFRIVLLQLVTMNLLPFARFNDRDDIRLPFIKKPFNFSSAKIATTGRYAFITPIFFTIIFVTFIILFPMLVSLNISDIIIGAVLVECSLLYWGADSQFKQYKEKDFITIHESVHILQFLFQYKLKKQGVIKRYFRNSLPRFEGKRPDRRKKTITKDEYLAIEEEILYQSENKLQSTLSFIPSNVAESISDLDIKAPRSCL